ncbi:MAG: response regulator [Acidobacteriia bacterium]|nr:response regulator [Terriglobia bacterium]
MVTLLRNAGYETYGALSVAEAMTSLKSHGEMDLLLSDLIMADLDGIALLEWAKKSFPDMPVIFVTAVYDVSVALTSIRNGAYDFLLKPFEREQLLAIVRRSMEHRRLKLENRAYQNNLEALVAARTEQLRQSMDDLSRSYDFTLQLAGDMMGFKDPVREVHAKRVTSFAIALARGMGLAGDQIRVIARGTFLHDIGMISIPDRILHKPGPLTAEEAGMVREHCYRGYRVLRKIPYLDHAAEIVYAHEERYDGSGYPRGLKGEEIPLGARIFSVAHALDAITTEWEYRPAQTLEAARSEIAQLSGRQFDPEIVRVFLEMPEKVWNDLKQEIGRQQE